MHGRSETAGALKSTSTHRRQRIQAAGHVASKCVQASQPLADACTAGWEGQADSVLAALDQQGSARIRLPNSRQAPLQAVLVNTAGGLTGDDDIRWSARASQASRLVVSTAACEKLYRTHGPAARQSTHLQVDQGARLDWLPQETIVFNGSSLLRSLEAHVAEDATALIAESLVLGRQAMREHIETARLRDSWRIHRGRTLLHAEELDLQFNTDSGADSSARRASMLHHYSAISTLVLVSPRSTEFLQNMADRVRALIPRERENLMAAATVLDHRLVIRALAIDGLSLRRFLLPCIEQLSDQLPIPQVWNV